MSTLTIHGAANGCAVCLEQFGRLRDFDQHQVINYSAPRAVTCRDPASLDGVRLVKDKNNVWQTRQGLAQRTQAGERLRAAKSR
jgi:hypothetical protein